MKQVKQLEFVSIFFDGDDFVVTHTDETHPAAYFTDDMEDALATAKLLDKPDQPKTYTVRNTLNEDIEVTRDELRKRMISAVRYLEVMVNDADTAGTFGEINALVLQLCDQYTYNLDFN